MVLFLLLVTSSHRLGIAQTSGMIRHVDMEHVDPSLIERSYERSILSHPRLVLEREP